MNHTMTKDADTPVVLVTGASRGIGLAIVQAFAGAGWRTAGCARAPGPALAAAADLVQDCDVSDGAAVHALVEAVLGRFGRLDALVCNAGLAGSNPVGSEDDDARWRAILATNLDGTWHACRAALPRLPDGHGRIVNIASVLALRGVADQPAYCAAKHGVLGLTRSLALQAAARGITVNAICPGFFRTKMANGLIDQLGEGKMAAAAPLGRLGDEEDLKGITLLYASDAGKHITGQWLAVDGGVSVVLGAA